MHSSPMNTQHRTLGAFSEMARVEFNQDQACLDLTRAAAALCDAPIALVSLGVGEHMWFHTRIGLDADTIPKRASFCECAMQSCDDVLVVEDASVDPRFADNDLVTGSPGIRFYVGAPLIMSTGEVLGNLCVLDTKPKTLAPPQLEQLMFLARQVADALERVKRPV